MRCLAYLQGIGGPGPNAAQPIEARAARLVGQLENFRVLSTQKSAMAGKVFEIITLLPDPWLGIVIRRILRTLVLGGGNVKTSKHRSR